MRWFAVRSKDRHAALVRLHGQHASALRASRKLEVEGSRVSVERKQNLDRRPRTPGALEDDGAAKSLDAVTQSNKARTPRGIGAADTVIADRKVQGTVDSRDVDLHS